MRHPIHPMLVHFPVATWSISTLGDIAGLFTNEQVSQVAGVHSDPQKHHLLDELASVFKNHSLEPASVTETGRRGHLRVLRDRS